MLELHIPLSIQFSDETIQSSYLHLTTHLRSVTVIELYYVRLHLLSKMLVLPLCILQSNLQLLQRVLSLRDQPRVGDSAVRRAMLLSLEL